MADLAESRRGLARRATRLGILAGGLFAGGLVLATAGCQEVGSGAVMTSSMYADFSVTSDGTGVGHASARLRIGSMLSSTLVELQPGDTLTASSGGVSKMMERTPEDLGGFSYTAAFPGDAPATPFAIAFTRQSDVSAPSSQTMLPSQVTHVTPLSGTTISRKQAFMVTWDALTSGNPDMIDVSLRGTCINGLASTNQLDSGQITIGANQVQAAPADPLASCSVQLTVARKRKGTVDPAYGAGGAFYGIQQTTVTLTSTP